MYYSYYIASIYFSKIVYLFPLQPALRSNYIPTWGKGYGMGVFEEDISKSSDKGKYDYDSSGSFGKRSSFGSTASTKSVNKNLRRRNTIVVILMGIAVLAALSVIVGIALYFTYHKGELELFFKCYIPMLFSYRSLTLRVHLCPRGKFMAV